MKTDMKPLLKAIAKYETSVETNYSQIKEIVEVIAAIMAAEEYGSVDRPLTSCLEARASHLLGQLADKYSHANASFYDLMAFLRPKKTVTKRKKPLSKRK
jgi:hypothetical protein